MIDKTFGDWEERKKEKQEEKSKKARINFVKVLKVLLYYDIITISVFYFG